jgi:hypothetical protein
MSSILEGIRTTNNILTESCHGLDRNQRIIVEGIYNEFKYIVEATLTADQINQLFTNIEQGATAAGGNRTMLGKGIDAGKAVNQAINNVGKWLQDTKPVQAFDQKYEDLKTKISAKFPGLEKNLTAMGTWAKENPGKTAAIIGVLTTIAALAGGPAGGAIAGQILRGTTELLKGEKISTAVGKGVKTAAIGALAGYGIDKIGDMLSGGVRMVADNLFPGARKLNLSFSAYGTGPSTFQNIPNVVGRAEDLSPIQSAFNSAAKAWSDGDYSKAASLFQQAKDAAAKLSDPQFVAQLAKDQESRKAIISGAKGIMQASDAFAAAAQGAASGAGEGGLKKKTAESRTLTEREVRVLFEGVMSWLGKKATNLTTKVTADKLMSAWKKAGSPTDSDQIVPILTQNGVSQDVIDAAFKQLKVPASQQTPQPNAQAAQPAATPQPTASAPAAPAAQPAAQPAQKPGAVNKTPSKPNAPTAGARTQKGAFAYNPLAEGDFEVHVPGFGTVPLEMLKRHVKELSKDFNGMIQSEEFIKAAHKTEQFYNALFALSKAMKAKSVEEGYSAGITGGSGLGIEKSPMEKVIEKPLGEAFRYYYPGATKARIKKKVKKFKHGVTGFEEDIAEGEVVSLQARKTPLVIAGNPYDWDIYDLRTNKMVANILGGDRHDKPLYEIRINSNGMTRTTRMLPTYVLKAGPNNNPPYKAYELEAPSEVDKIEKSPGPGGTTKLKPDTMDVFSHIAKQTAKGRYYGYNLILVEEGLDQYEIIEKALGAKIMEIDDAMELGYTDWNEDDGSGYPILYLGNQKNEGYTAGLDEKINTPGGMGQSYRKFTPKSAGADATKADKEDILQEYDTKTIDSVVERLPKGLTVNNFTHPAFKEFLYQKYHDKVKADWDKLWPFFSKEYKEKHGIKEYKQNPYQIVSGDSDFFDHMLVVIPKGLNASELYKQAFKEFLYKKFADREWADFKKNRFTYWDAYQKIGGDKKEKKFFGLFDEEQLDELSPETLARYKKAAGADASKADKEGDFERGNKRFSGIVRATKKEFDKPTKESSIMKGLQNEVKRNESLKGK